MTKRYGTIKHGSIKFEIGSRQDKFLHSKDLPHSHVKEKNGKKSIKRF